LTFPSVSFYSGIRNDPAFFGLGVEGGIFNHQWTRINTNFLSSGRFVVSVLSQSRLGASSPYLVLFADIRVIRGLSHALEKLQFVPARVEVRDFVTRGFQLSFQIEDFRTRFRIKIRRGK